MYDELLSDCSTVGFGATAVLGATPEIRELSAESNHSVLCIDESRTMFEAMSVLMDSRPCEVYLEMNWLDLHLPQTARLVLGDGALMFLNPDEQERLLEIVHDMLVSGGRAVLKGMVNRPTR
jgi:hypothetical protein